MKIIIIISILVLLLFEPILSVSESIHSDKLLYVTTTSVQGDFGSSFEIPQDLCAQEANLDCLEDTTFPVLTTTAPSPARRLVGEDFTSIPGQKGLNPGGIWWWMRTGLSVPSLLDDTTWTSMLNTGPKYTGARKNEPPVKYWTGADAFGVRTFCANDIDSSPFQSNQFPNRPTNLPSDKQGASVGLGFEKNSSLDWIAGPILAQCNSSLPFLCGCRAKAPGILLVHFRETGQLELVFDKSTNGLTLGVFPCSDVFNFRNKTSGIIITNHLGTCKFRSETQLMATFPRNSKFDYVTHEIVFVGVTIGRYMSPLLDRVTSTKIKSVNGVDFVRFPRTLPISYYYAIFPDVRLIVPNQHYSCATKLKIVIESNDVLFDAGRPLDSGFILVSPCFPSFNSPAPGDNPCKRPLTRTELDSKVIVIDTTAMTEETAHTWSLELNTWLHALDVELEPITEYIEGEESGPQTTLIFGKGVSVLLPTAYSQSYSENENILITPEILIEDSCFNLSANNNKTSFRYEWFITRELTRRVLARLGTNIIKTTKNLNLAKHEIKGARTGGGSCAYYETCSLNYVTSFKVFVLENNGTHVLESIAHSTFFTMVISSTPLVLDLTLILNPDRSIKVDASKICDPDVATKDCIPSLGYVGKSGEPRGIVFTEFTCETVPSPGFLVPCTDFDFLGATHEPSISPTLPTRQPSEAPVVPSQAPVITLEPSTSPFSSAPSSTPSVSSPTRSPNTQPTRIPTESPSFATPTESPTTNIPSFTFAPLKPNLYRFCVLGDTINSYTLQPPCGECECLSEIPTVNGICLPKFCALLTVTDAGASCQVPLINAPTFPNKVSLPSTGILSIPVEVYLNFLPVTQGVFWEVKTSSTPYTALNPNTPTTILKSPLSSTPDRPNLAIPAVSLYEGVTYTFRLSVPTQGDCEIPQAQVEISVQINDKPFGGSCTLNVYNGTSFTTEFTITTSGWVDSDLPLEYAFGFLNPGDVLPSVLSSFSSSSVLKTRLSSDFVTGNRIACFARDSFGAKTRVLSDEVIIKPFYVPGVTTAQNLPDPADVLEEIEGATAEEKLRIFVSLASSAASTTNTQSGDDTQFLEEYRKAIATIAINLITEQAANGGSLESVGLQVSCLLSAFKAETNLGPNILEDTANLVETLIANAKAAFGSESQKPGFSSTGLLPDNFESSFLSVLSKLGKGIDQALFETRRRRRLSSRFLLPTDCDTFECRSVNKLRKTLNELVHTIMQGYVPGSPIQSFDGADISVTILRESTELVGTSTRLNLGSTAISLPPNVLQGVRNQDSPNTVDIALVRFRFNVRELAESPNLPPGFNFDYKNVTIEGIPLDNFTIQEMTSLVFMSSEDSTIFLDPINLESPLNITLTLPDGYQFPNATLNQTLSCGAWDDGFAGWSADGCKVVSFTSTTVTCSCTHASDYAAWNSFLTNVGGGEIGVVAIIAVIVVGILLPGLVIVYLVFMMWAYRRDTRDADGVHVGALLLLTKNKLRMRAKQRKFFQLLRENAAAPKPLVVDTEKAKRLEAEKFEAISKIKTTNRVQRFLEQIPITIRRWFNALIYDHSVFGIYTRFDPYYTRTQRVTVVTCVICGNLFVTALFFDLKTAQDVSLGFIIGVIFLVGLVIAIPVKFIVRFLFRQTQATIGSNMDRVTQIFRVSQLHQDLLPTYASRAEQADIEMLLAFRVYYLCKAELAQTQFLLETKQNEGKPSRFNCCRKTREAPNAAKRKSIAQRVGLMEESLDNIDELKKAIKIATQDLKKSKQSLKECCELARTEWAKVPRKNPRVETLRKQQSTIMKFAALLYDEADNTPPREKPKRFSPMFIYFAWAFILIYLGVCLGFSARWVLAYTSTQVEDDPKDANAIIGSWLIGSVLGIVLGLFAAEPLVEFIRFSLIPCCLERYGNGFVSMQTKRMELDDDSDNKFQDEETANKAGQTTALVSKQITEVKDGDETGVRTSLGAKADFIDEFDHKLRKGKKGETHSETAVAMGFDMVADVVDAFT